MGSPRSRDVIPLRPLTLGELLDTAVGLLHQNAVALLAVGFVLSFIEQTILLLITHFTSTDSSLYSMIYNSLYEDHLDGTQVGGYWLIICLGQGLEATIIAALGGLAARAASAALTDRHLSPRDLLRVKGVRFPSVVLIAVLIGIITSVATCACWLPWIVTYALLGLAIPAIVIDGTRSFGALMRSCTLSYRIFFRAGWIRLIGYLCWFVIQVGLGLGGVAALSQITPRATAWITVTESIVLIMINTVAYANLACLDAVLYCETRMRTEGLDISITRATSRGESICLKVTS